MHKIDNGLIENFFNYEGRLNRKRYIFRNLALWGISFALYVLMIILIVIIAMVAQPHSPDDEAMLGGGALLLYGLFFLLCLPLTVSAYMLMIRRLHDLNLSGFFCLLTLVPFVNLGLEIYLLFKQGTVGDNEYGPDPLDPAGYVYAGDVGAPPAAPVAPGMPPAPTAPTAPAAPAAPAQDDTDTAQNR